MSDLIERLHHSIETAIMDNETVPGTDAHHRHAERLEAMAEAVASISELEAERQLVIDSGHHPGEMIEKMATEVRELRAERDAWEAAYEAERAACGRAYQQREELRERAETAEAERDRLKVLHDVSLASCGVWKECAEKAETERADAKIKQSLVIEAHKITMADLIKCEKERDAIEAATLKRCAHFSAMYEHPSLAGATEDWRDGHDAACLGLERAILALTPSSPSVPSQNQSPPAALDPAAGAVNPPPAAVHKDENA